MANQKTKMKTKTNRKKAKATNLSNYIIETTKKQDGYTLGDLDSDNQSILFVN